MHFFENITFFACADYFTILGGYLNPLTKDIMAPHKNKTSEYRRTDGLGGHNTVTNSRIIGDETVLEQGCENNEVYKVKKIVIISSSKFDSLLSGNEEQRYIRIDNAVNFLKKVLYSLSKYTPQEKVPYDLASYKGSNFLSVYDRREETLYIYRPDKKLFLRDIEDFIKLGGGVKDILGEKYNYPNGVGITPVVSNGYNEIHITLDGGGINLNDDDVEKNIQKKDNIFGQLGIPKI